MICFSLFCPISLGHPRAEWILLPRRAAAFWEGPKGFTGRNRESRSREAAGRRNYPEAVPKERSGENGTSAKSPSYRGDQGERSRGGKLCGKETPPLLCSTIVKRRGTWRSPWCRSRPANARRAAAKSTAMKKL